MGICECSIGSRFSIPRKCLRHVARFPGKGRARVSAVKQEFVQSAAIERSWNSTLLSQGALIVIAYGLLYARLVPGLVNDWYTFSPYSYGFLVPVIAAYLAWQKRGRLKNLPI